MRVNAALKQQEELSWKHGGGWLGGSAGWVGKRAAEQAGMRGESSRQKQAESGREGCGVGDEAAPGVMATHRHWGMDEAASSHWSETDRQQVQGRAARAGQRQQPQEGRTDARTR